MVERPVLFLDEEAKQMVFPRKVFEFDDEGLRVGRLHVVNAELAEVADDDPSRTSGEGEFRRVFLRLLIRSERRAVRPFLRFARIDVGALLFDENLRLRDSRVDEVRLPRRRRRVGFVDLDLPFENDRLFRLVDAKDVAKEREPERLRLALLAAPCLPIFGELPRGLPLPCHPYSSWSSSSFLNASTSGKAFRNSSDISLDVL